MAGFALSSPAFEPGAMIPARFTGDRQDLSPSLQWTEPPAGTRSFVLIVDDPDAPGATWVHWVLSGIPPDFRHLPEGVEKSAVPHGIGGAVNGKNTSGTLGYEGPAPPPGAPHRYVFRLYALDMPITMVPGISKAESLAAMKGHILAEAQFMGTYQRK